MGAILAFKTDWGLIGLNSGFASASFIQSISYMLILLLNDWQDIADKAGERIRREEMEELAARNERVSDNFEAVK